MRDDLGPDVELDELAGVLGGTIEPLPRVPAAVERLTGVRDDPLARSFGFRRHGFDGRWYRRDAGDEPPFTVHLGVVTSIVFAANRPNPVVAATEPRGRVADLQIFVAPQLPAPDEWLAHDASARRLSQLELGPSERLAVQQNGVDLVLVPGGADRDLGRLDALAAFAAALPPVSARDERVDPSALPGPLRPLAPLLARWAVGDDLQRAERVERATIEELERLTAAVLPVLREIDAYLDRAGAPLPPAAAALGDLAQAALEAAQELRRR